MGAACAKESCQHPPPLSKGCEISAATCASVRLSIPPSLASHRPPTTRIGTQQGQPNATDWSRHLIAVLGRERGRGEGEMGVQAMASIRRREACVATRGARMVSPPPRLSRLMEHGGCHHHQLSFVSRSMKRMCQPHPCLFRVCVR